MSDLTQAQIEKLDSIVEHAKKHGMDFGGRSDLMLNNVGHTVHVSMMDGSFGLYAAVNAHGHDNGLVIYEMDTVCSTYEGDDRCGDCEADR